MSALQSSLASLRTSTSLLSSSLDILSSGTSDLPRLAKVLLQTRHFELVPSSALVDAQENLLAELIPEIEALLQKVEAIVDKRERRDEWLRARHALYEGRLGREGSRDRQEAIAAEGRRGAEQVDNTKAIRLRQKKERLSYAVDRLQLQANQKERQLRMSMAHQLVGNGERPADP